jgi:transcriptional regulator with XRE-family HTH domain
MATTEFGHTVRRLRDRVSPEAAGLPVGGQRRAAGLRREELALLAGISVDYVTRLEQGRATNPSAQVVEALGRALRVSGAEREHLFTVAGLVPPGQGTVPAYLTPSVQRMLDRLTGTPVAVFDAAWTLLLANPLYVALMGEWHGNDRNAVSARAAASATHRGPGARSRPRRSPGCVRPRAGIRPTSGCGAWSRSCARTVAGSPSCGIPEAWTSPRDRARPSITRGWAP